MGGAELQSAAQCHLGVLHSLGLEFEQHLHGRAACSSVHLIYGKGLLLHLSALTALHGYVSPRGKRPPTSKCKTAGIRRGSGAGQLMRLSRRVAARPRLCRRRWAW